MSDKTGKSGCIWIVVAVLGMTFLVGQCRSCSNKKKTDQQENIRAEQAAIETKQFNQELVEFLAEYDPPLSTKRGETIRAIKDNQEICDKLRAKIDKYPGEEAKAIFRTKAERYEKMIQQLNQLLAAIDKNASIAMAQREASADEGGGMQSADSQLLINSASAILKQAASLQDDVESFSNDKPAPTDNTSPQLEKSTSTTGSITEDNLNKTDPLGTSPPLLTVAEDPKMKSLSDKADEVKRITDKAAAALETMRKNEAVTAQNPKSSSEQKADSPSSNPKPAMDREAIQKEIRRLNAAISNNEASLNQARARMNQITRNGTVPIVKGSRQHVEYLIARRSLEESESQLPELRYQRDLLNEQLGNL